MEASLLKSLGKIASIGGISLGVFLLIFQDVLKQKILPDAGLTSDQAYHVVLALLVLVFGIAAIGILAWLISRGATGSVSTPVLVLLVVLILDVLLTTFEVGATTAPPGPAARSRYGECCLGQA